MGEQIRDWVALVLLLLGAVLALSGSVGLIRFPEVLSRMHAMTKPQVLGLIFILAAVAVRIPTWGTISTLVLIAVFQLMTVPISAHMIGRAAYRGKHLRRNLLIRDELADAVAAASAREDAETDSDG